MFTGYLVIAGLGNPGSQYFGTRHNIGFAVLDRLFEAGWREPNMSFVGSWKEASWGQSKQSIAQVVEAKFDSSKLWLIKPLTFMNRSGEPLVDFMKFHKIEPRSLVVVHDEIDLEFGSIRIKQAGGDGGHNGIRSIQTALGSKDFTRVRVGVGRPTVRGQVGAPELVNNQEVSSWVLGRFTKEQSSLVGQTVDRAIDALKELFLSGVIAAQNKFN